MYVEMNAGKQIERKRSEVGAPKGVLASAQHRHIEHASMHGTVNGVGGLM